MKKSFLPIPVAGLIVGLAVAGASAATEPVAATPASSPIDSAREACLAAIPGYQQALAADARDAVTHARLGVCFQRTGQVNQAIRAYKAALAVDDRQATTWNNLGTAYHGQDELRRAVKHYRKALRLDPNLAQAHRNMGTALIALGKTEEGFEALARAFALSPDVFGASGPVKTTMAEKRLAQQYFYFAKLSAAAGNIDAALAFLQQARELGYDDASAVRSDPDFAKVKRDERFTAMGW